MINFISKWFKNAALSITALLLLIVIFLWLSLSCAVSFIVGSNSPFTTSLNKISETLGSAEKKLKKENE